MGSVMDSKYSRFHGWGRLLMPDLSVFIAFMVDSFFGTMLGGEAVFLVVALLGFFTFLIASHKGGLQLGIVVLIPFVIMFSGLTSGGSRIIAEGSSVTPILSPIFVIGAIFVLCILIAIGYYKLFGVK